MNFIPQQPRIFWAQLEYTWQSEKKINPERLPLMCKHPASGGKILLESVKSNIWGPIDWDMDAGSYRMTIWTAPVEGEWIYESEFDRHPFHHKGDSLTLNEVWISLGVL